ncbi:hypothetical protein OMK73_15815 [Cupriavidus sp. D39]|nr:hypothetical protein [Cupriavidus sp. D39]MCY0855053.1 hypothetical protein [Cupriavidus sp. D39]
MTTTFAAGEAAIRMSNVEEDFMKPVDFTGAHGSELTPVTGHQAQFAQIVRRDEAAAHQPEARQDSQPLRIVHVRFPAWDMLDEMRIDDPGLDARAFEMGIDTLPVDARAFHDDEFDIQFKKPGRQGATIALEPAEFTALLFDGAVRVFNDGRDNV